MSTFDSAVFPLIVGAASADITIPFNFEVLAYTPDDDAAIVIEIAGTSALTEAFGPVDTDANTGSAGDALTIDGTAGTAVWVKKR